MTEQIRVQDLRVEVIRYGESAPLPVRRTLHAGPLTAQLENGDLRYIMAGDVEVVRRLYMAVRDQNWGTIPYTFTSFNLKDSGDAFDIKFTAVHVNDDVEFAWTGTITGSTNGVIIYELVGEPRRSFLRNRIGFCLLHPMDWAGTEVEVETPDGVVSGVLPERISPHQPFVDMKRISHAVGPKGRISIEFEGDLFEMEDQRNWTDASYKTYSTPLRVPYPKRVEPGERIAQKVTISFSGIAPKISAAGGPIADIQVGRNTLGPLPAIGFRVAAVHRELEDGEISRVSGLKPSHLRLDLDLSDDDWGERLRLGSRQADMLSANLELSVIADESGGGLTDLATEISDGEIQVSRAFVFPPPETQVTFPRYDLYSSSSIIDQARKAFGKAGLSVSVCGGTRAYFTELNRAIELPVEEMDVVSYTINPQIHAFDNLSLVETLAAQTVTVESAKQIAPGKPIAVGPITLAPLFNPNATGPQPKVGPDRLPPSVDKRQLSLFGAAWTVGSLHRLASAGVDSLTYFETVGWRGLMERSSDLTRRALFPSEPGQLFPLFHVFAALSDYRRGQILPVMIREPLSFEAIAVRDGDHLLVLVASFNEEPRNIQVLIPGFENVRIKYLDETTAADAAHDPSFFRGGDGDSVTSDSGGIELMLKPFSIARIAGTAAS